MKRGTLFFAAFLSAAATFGSLLFFVGPERSGWNHYGHGWHHHYYDDDYNHHEHRPLADSNLHFY